MREINLLINFRNIAGRTQPYWKTDTGDETYVFQYDAQSKRQGLQLNSPVSETGTTVNAKTIPWSELFTLNELFLRIDSFKSMDQLSILPSRLWMFTAVHLSKISNILVSKIVFIPRKFAFSHRNYNKTVLTGYPLYSPHLSRVAVIPPPTRDFPTRIRWYTGGRNRGMTVELNVYTVTYAE
jgi:hypothetical protein